MSGEPLVSVIVLTYNNYQHYKECIDSILMQDYSNIEIIVRDDCSENFPSEHFRKHIERHKCGNIISYKISTNTKNMGTVKNYNNAIKESHGEYIIPLEIDDCFYDKSVISSIVECFINTKCLILTAYRAVCVKDINRPNYFLPKKNQIRLLNKGGSRLFKALCKENFISGACTPYSRKFVEEYGFFDEEYKLLEDYPKYLQVLRDGGKIQFLDKPIIKYRIGGVSTSKKPNMILKIDFDLAIRKEILPYKNLIGFFLHRIKTYEYYRRINFLPRHKLKFTYFDVFLYKMLIRFKKVFQ